MMREFSRTLSEVLAPYLIRKVVMFLKPVLSIMLNYLNPLLEANKKHPQLIFLLPCRLKLNFIEVYGAG